jgi:hypothetical protein
MVPTCFNRTIFHASVRLRAAGVMLVCLGAMEAHAFEMVRCSLADGFDFPVGKPEAKGYHKARGYTSNGHLGEDWDGDGGGDTDLGDPIYVIGRGVVVLSEDVHLGWGNCVIVRHAFRDATGKIDMVDSLYGHLLDRKVKVGQVVERGEVVGRMGSNNGMYSAHLHLEVRKNLAIGMNRTKFARDSSNYYSPTAFIQSHRHLYPDSGKYEIPINTFAPHGQDLNREQIAFASNRGMGVSTKSSGESGKAVVTSSSRGAASDDVTIKKTSRGLSIPIDAGGGVPSGSSRTTTLPPLPKISGTSRPAQRPAVPTPAADEPKGDFWSRLKSKLLNGQTTDPGSGATR